MKDHLKTNCSKLQSLLTSRMYALLETCGLRFANVNFEQVANWTYFATLAHVCRYDFHVKNRFSRNYQFIAAQVPTVKDISFGLIHEYGVLYCRVEKVNRQVRCPCKMSC